MAVMNRDEAIELIRRSALAEHAEELVGRLAPSARVIVGDEPGNSGDRLAASHFGGLPSLPSDTAWPDWDKREYLKAKIDSLEKQLEAYVEKTKDQLVKKPGIHKPLSVRLQDSIAKKREELSSGRVPLAFLGQLSLREIRAVASLPGWPSEGILAFFYDASQIWGYSPLDIGHCRVLFFPEDVSLTRAVFPENLMQEARYPERSLTLKCEWTLPTYPELDTGNQVLGQMDEYCDLISRLNEDGPTQVHRCGGYPQEIQGDMRLECELVTHGIYCGDPSGYKDPRRADLEKDAPAWRLLAQFDSDHKRLGWMWGDAGRVYFWARQQDIEAADFTRSWAILQCG
jgi:uncharacterized protein YwqG